MKTWIDPWREYVSEFIGVALFVFLSSSVVVSQLVFGKVDILTTAVAIGLSYAVLLYATGHTSGGFLNPAVVISLWLVKRLSGTRSVFYILAQMLGSFLGTFLVWLAFGERAVQTGFGAPAPGLGVSLENIFTIEVILSGVFVFLLYSTAVSKTAPNIFAPLSLGLFVVVATIIAYPISGAGIIVSRSVGPIILSGDYSNLLAYITGGVSGGLVGVVYEYIFLKSKKK